MATAQALTILEVREYISDYPANNLLLNNEQEFSDTFINLCMGFAIEEFNAMPPITIYQQDTFPSKNVLLLGSLWKMFDGKAALLARNNFSYADGGLQIPLEERYQLYAAMASNFGQQFQSAAGRLKVNLNMNDGWDEVQSDYSTMPLW